MSDIDTGAAQAAPEDTSLAPQVEAETTQETPGDDPAANEQDAEGAEGEQPPEKPKPTHYKVVSISLYQEDIERLERLVAELKKRGHTKANKSQLIRYALDTVDLDGMPRGY